MSEKERCFFFFFQAEDGIRDADVTGVQTCALPIYEGHSANPFCEAGTGVLSRSSDSPAELQSTNRGGLSRLFPSAVRVCPGTPEQADRAFGPRRSRCSSCTGVLGLSRESPEELHSQPQRSISSDPLLLAFCRFQGPAVVGHDPTCTRHSDEASQQAFGRIPLARRSA